MYFNSEFSAKSDFVSRTQMMDVVDDVLYLKNRQPITKEYSVDKNIFFIIEKSHFLT